MFWRHYRPNDVRTFLSPPDVTNSLLALGSWGRTLENWPTTCLRMLGGASWRRGSRAGRWTQRVKMFLRAFLDCEEREWGSCSLGVKLITLEVESAQLPLFQLKLLNTRVQKTSITTKPSLAHTNKCVHPCGRERQLLLYLLHSRFEHFELMQRQRSTLYFNSKPHIT